MGGKHSKSMIKKLEERDISKIKLVFSDLAAPSAGKGIDIDTFKQFTQFSDMVSERAFVQFASKKPTLIDLEEFTAGLAVCHRGTEKEKLKVIFRIFAVSFDKVSKDEVSVVLNSAVQAATWNTQTREDLKPPTELVQKLIEMGFPRSQCDKAVEATKATTVDEAVTWIVNHKQDPTSDATVLLNSMFEGHPDGVLNWKKFKKWATNAKRPKEFAGFTNGFPTLYERAILWTSHAKTNLLGPGGTVKVDNLIDFTIEDTKPAIVPTPAIPTGKKDKRRSHRSLSQIMNRRSVDSMAAIQQQSGTSDSFLTDIAFGPATPTLAPVTLNPIHPTTGPEPVAIPTTPVAPTTPANLSAPTTPTLLPRQPSNPGSAPSTPSSIPPPPSTAAPLGVSASPPVRGRSSTSLSLGAAAKKKAQKDDDDDSDWSSDEEPHEIKPVISVVIRDKAVEPAPPVDLKKAVSHITLPDLPKSSKPRGHSTVGARAARRSSASRLPLENAFFDPAKTRDSLGDDDSAPSTPTGSLTPTGSMTPSGGSTPTRSMTPTTSYTATPAQQSKEEIPTATETLFEVTPTSTPTATSTPTLAPTATATPQTATELPSQPVKQPSAASEHMRLGMTHLEKGNFADALQEVDKSIHAMLEYGDPLAVKGEANFCVAYKVALGLLLEIRELETKFVAQQTNELASRMGYLSKILSDIPLKTNHRIVCVRMAISKNMHPQAGNYAVAARLVEALLLKGAPDREPLQAKLRKCKEEGKDATLPEYTCPYCNEQCSSASLKCNCGRPVRWCFKTYELITTKNFLQCSFCNALVSTNTTVKIGDNCEFCKHGTFEEKM